MNFEELEHIVCAARDVTGETEFIAIGSQSLLISFHDPPRELRRSPELDITARSVSVRLEVADLIDGKAEPTEERGIVLRGTHKLMLL